MLRSMKKSRSRPIATAIITSLTISCAALMPASGQEATATTDPVGFVSFTVNPNSDQRFGIPMAPAPVFQGTVGSVSGSTVSATGIPVLTGANYLLVTSGSAKGSWEQISSSSSDSVVLEAAISGLQAGDQIAVRPFWTLGTLLPNGGGLPASSNVFAPVGLVLVNDPAASGINIPASSLYLYHDGAQGPAGWYDASNPSQGLRNDVIISPEVSITIRNQSQSTASITVVGSVPVSPQSIAVTGSASQQDNLIYNQFPADVRLDESQLHSSGAVAASSNVFAPSDLLLVFNPSNTGINPSASAIYLYHDGSQGPAGWYNANSPAEGLKNDVILPAGAAFIVRKAQGSSSAQWTPEVPYSANLGN